jgi:hypothetical protein
MPIVTNQLARYSSAMRDVMTYTMSAMVFPEISNHYLRTARMFSTPSGMKNWKHNFICQSRRRVRLVLEDYQTIRWHCYGMGYYYHASITNRLGLSSKLSAHNPFLHLIQLHSNMFHNLCNLIFYVQQRTIKASNVKRSKIKFWNFEKFQFFLFWQDQTRSHSDSTGIKIWLTGIFFIFK